MGTPPDSSRRLSAIMFTDMVGYSALAQRDEALTLELLEEHRQLLRTLFLKHDGREIKTIGDAFLAEFHSALSAVECAVAIQQRLAERNLNAPAGRRMQLRIGIHLGDVVHREQDVLGDGVNIASRVEALAQPGGICITDIVYRQVEGRLSAPIEPLGRVGLKNISAPLALYRVISGPNPGTLLAARARAFTKDSRLGRRLALAGVLAVALTAAIGAQLFRSSGTSELEGPRLTLAVADFANETQDPELDSLSGMLATSLQQSRRLTVLSRSALFDVLRKLGKDRAQRIDEGLGREISREAGVDALVVVTARKLDQLYSLDLKVIDPAKGTLLGAAQREASSKSKLPAALDALSEDVRRSLHERADEIAAARQSVTHSTTTNLEAYHHYFEGERLMGRMKLDEAEREFTRAVSLDPDFALGWYRLAYIRTWWHQDPAQPLAKALALIERVPEKERYLVRGLEAIAADRDDDAMRLYREALRHFPGDKEILYQLGDVAFHEGLSAEALDALTRVVAIDPGFDRAWHHLVWAAIDSGDLQRALETAQSYVRQAPTEEAFRTLAEMHLARGELDQALATFGRAVELFPQSSTPRMGRAKVHIYRDALELAEAEYRELSRSELLPVRLEGEKGLAWVDAFHGKFRAAAKRWEAIGKSAAQAGDDRLVSRSHASLAFLTAFGRRSDEGVLPLIERAFALTPQDNSVVFLSVECFLWAGMKEPLAKFAPYAAGLPQAPLLTALEPAEGVLRRDVVEGLEAMVVRTKTPNLVGMHLLEAYLARNEPQKVIALTRRMEAFQMETFQEPEAWRSGYYPVALYSRAKAHAMLGEVEAARRTLAKLTAMQPDPDADLWLTRQTRELAESLSGVPVKSR